MKDSNIPKFLEQDLPLFGQLIQDLFPESKIIEVQNEDLDNQIQKSMDEMKLLFTKTF